MSIIYNGEHSITFIDPDSNEYNSWSDLHLIPSMKSDAGTQIPSIAISNGIGTNRLLDLTNSISGRTVYTRPESSLEFSVDIYKWFIFEYQYREDSDEHDEIPVQLDSITIKDRLNDIFDGRVFKVLFHDSPRSIYTARVTLSEFSITESYPIINLKINWISSKQLDSIRAILNNDSPYLRTTDNLSVLKPYISVIASYDGIEYTYDSVQDSSDFNISGNISLPGSHQITIYFGGKTSIISVNSYVPNDIDIQLLRSPVPTSPNINALKKYLFVSLLYQLCDTRTGINPKLYTLSGDIKNPGNNTITLVYDGEDQSGFSIEKVISISTIGPRYPQRISASYYNNQPYPTINDNINVLKKNTRVYAIYDDGSSSPISSSQYELSGDISTVGTHRINVYYTLDGYTYSTYFNARIYDNS